MDVERLHRIFVTENEQDESGQGAEEALREEEQADHHPSHVVRRLGIEELQTWEQDRERQEVKTELDQEKCTYVYCTL